MSYNGDNDEQEINIGYDSDEINSEDEEDEEEEEEKDTSLGDSNVVYNMGKDRVQDPIMTKYEYARCISSLAGMYSLNFPLHPKLKVQQEKKNIYDPLDLAELHILDQTLPFPIDIQRPIKGNEKVYDVWNPTEMILPPNLPLLHIEIRESLGL